MPRTSKAEIDRRRADALAMRLGGATYRAIGERNFVSYETSRTDVRLALDGIEQRDAIDRRRYRALLMLRLDRLFSIWWGPSVGCQCPPFCPGDPCPNPSPPDPDAAARVLDIMDAQARIMGLGEAPTPTEGQGAGTGA